LKINGEAIYKTRPMYPYKDGDVCFTRSKDWKIIYAIRLLKENETVPFQISFQGISVETKPFIRLLGSTQNLQWKKEGETVTVFLPPNISAQHAVVLKIIL
jgi:alpha-L-fucosidase